MYERSSGILMPISSLSSRFGIGTLGKEAFNFIDFLSSSNQKYWQLLPLGHVSYGDSPYSSFSSYAGNPYFIDLEILIEEGVLTWEDCTDLDSECDYIDYEKQFNLRYDILYKAFINSRNKCSKKLKEFKDKNQWVHDYSLFMALKYHFNQSPWYKWDEDIAFRSENALSKYRLLLKEKMEFWTFVQMKFFEQYFKLKNYANLKNIQLIGDIPIYSAKDSVDVWTERGFYITDENNIPSLSAGVPPDAFSEVGQLWGNPVYDWDKLKENSYELWIKKLRWHFNLYDVLRIDHFRGFDEFWAVHNDANDALNGKWYHANGKELFERAIEELGNVKIIAEDLGIITERVTKLKERFNFPGMKVLQFAFDKNPMNPHLPENYEKNSVAYTGTHDNDTLKGWFEKLDSAAKMTVLEKLGTEECDENRVVELLIEYVLKSNSNLTVIPLQDYLFLGSQGRINTPSTLGGNWAWRVKKTMLNKELSEKIKLMTTKSNR